MSKIHEAVSDLRRAPGVRGAALLTLDGLMAAADLDSTLSSDVVAGLASYLLMTTNRSLEEGGLGRCGQMTVHATHGKTVFVDLDDSYLVVLFDQFADVADASQDIQDATLRIRRASRLA
jgi:predicted regulator of Ras-like GTPase activity (Roadblock/LC7/MglB family)